MRLLVRAVGKVAGYFNILAALSLAALVVLVVVAVFMRYFVGRPFDFTEELVSLAYMAMVFLALPIATVWSRHVNVTIVSDRAGYRMRHPLRLAAELVTLVFCAWFAWEAYAYVVQSYNFKARTDQVGLILWPWTAIMFICFVVTTLAVLLRVLGYGSREVDAASDVPSMTGDGL